MPDPTPQDAGPPPLTLAGARTGMRLTLPLVPGVIVFGTAFGAAAAQKGFDVWLTLSLSAFVFAGASQMVALELPYMSIIVRLARSGLLDARAHEEQAQGR